MVCLDFFRKDTKGTGHASKRGSVQAPKPWLCRPPPLPPPSPLHSPKGWPLELAVALSRCSVAHAASLAARPGAGSGGSGSAAAAGEERSERTAVGARPPRPRRKRRPKRGGSQVGGNHLLQLGGSSTGYTVIIGGGGVL